MTRKMGDAKRILIVDDDYDFLESLQLLLTNEGHDARAVANGYDAIIQYREFNPDIVLLDVKMPGIDGYETFLRIKRHDDKAMIVLTSSYSIDDVKYEKAKRQDLTGLINKPIEIDTLRKIIEKHKRADP